MVVFINSNQSVPNLKILLTYKTFFVFTNLFTNRICKFKMKRTSAVYFEAWRHQVAVSYHTAHIISVFWNPVLHLLLEWCYCRYTSGNLYIWKSLVSCSLHGIYFRAPQGIVNLNITIGTLHHQVVVNSICRFVMILINISDGSQTI